MEGQKKRKSFGEWITSGKVNKRLCIIAFTAFPLLLLIVFTYFPFAKMIQFSFYDMGYIGSREFVGLDNYVQVFTRDDCFAALKLSLYYLIGAFIQIGLALLLASVLTQKIKGAGIFKGVMFFPYLVCGIAVGFIFKFFYTRGFVLDTVLGWFGVPQEALPYWLRDTRINNISLVATSIWRYVGQNMVLFIGAMSSVDNSLYEAAAIDGANGWQKFRYVTFPGIKTIVVLNMILSISGSLSAFEPPYVITGGEFGTATYFVVMDELAHVSNKVGLASAMAVVLMGLIFLVTLFQKWFSWFFLGDFEHDSKLEQIRMKKKLQKMAEEDAAFAGKGE